jgi:hypothetical protein
MPYTRAGNTMAASSRKEKTRVFEAIDSVLKQVFGEEATHLMYHYLEQQYSWSQKDFSEKIDTFAKGLEEFLSSGAYMVEGKILDNICEGYDVFRKAKDFEERDFANQIRLATQKA